jgi:hypothetical protein
MICIWIADKDIKVSPETLDFYNNIARDMKYVVKEADPKSE